MSGLVLSLFPGIGLLDMAFEEEGFCVVRGPDLLWGGDIRRFHPPSGRFDGVIGGPPCQRFSGLGNVNITRWGDARMTPLEAKCKPLHAIQWARVSFRKVIRLLEDGRLPATSSIFQQRDPKGECNG